eukprot:c16958_g1_i2.p3 GENE.c16958_g1_i2~~c16958_g1_i2.p3  ORF type:complete len:285 (+),score=62.97 c16958_g1_i2:2048-2902(+)
MAEESAPLVDKKDDDAKQLGWWDMAVEAMSFKSLYGSPKEIWIVFALVMLDSFSYFGISFILVLFLSSDIGYSDQDAGWIYGVFGMVISVYSIVLGCAVDVLGVRWTLLVGHTLMLISRAIITFTHSREVLLLMLFFVLPMGSAFVGPAMSTSLRRYTNDANRSQAFSLFIVMMNVGGLLAAPTVDIIRGVYQDDAGTGQLNEYRVILLASSVASFLSAVLTVFLRDIDVDANGKVNDYKVVNERPVAVFVEIFTSSRFWRFMLFILLLVGVPLVRVLQRNGHT